MAAKLGTSAGTVVLGASLPTMWQDVQSLSASARPLEASGPTWAHAPLLAHKLALKVQIAANSILRPAVAECSVAPMLTPFLLVACKACNSCETTPRIIQLRARDDGIRDRFLLASRRHRAAGRPITRPDILPFCH